MLYAGVKEKIITPDFPTLLAGYPLPKDRYHNAVNDDLKAHCFYLKNDETEIAIVTLDLISWTKRRAKMVREQINKVCGIKPMNILISATHTHSGPVCGSVPFELWDDRKEMYPYYLDQVSQKIVDGVKEAKESAFSAKIAMGKGHCGKEQGVGGNRRHKDGLADPEVWVTAIKDDNDKLRGVLVNYALHPTFLHAENKTITADYPAYIYEYFQKQDSNIVVGFQNGAAGNQSSRHFRTGQTFEEAKRVGYAIAAEAEKVIADLKFDNNPTLFTDYTEIVPSMKRIPSVEEARATKEEAEKSLENSRKNNEPYAVQRTWECTLIGANGMLRKAEAGKEGLDGWLTNSPFEIFVLGIGENRIVTVPCEIFVEFALRLKKESPYKNTYLASTSNGYGSGYVYTPESLKEGGYEPIGSIYADTVGDEIVDAALELLKKN
jgi:neutral ceramidase